MVDIEKGNQAEQALRVLSTGTEVTNTHAAVFRSIPHPVCRKLMFDSRENMTMSAAILRPKVCTGDITDKASKRGQSIKRVTGQSVFAHHLQRQHAWLKDQTCNRPICFLLIICKAARVAKVSNVLEADEPTSVATLRGAQIQSKKRYLFCANIDGPTR